MNQQHSFLRVTIYFGLFATIAAGLIGLGKESWNLPVLVGFCSILSIVYTDVLGWFSLHRWLAYIAMIAGAGIAMIDFLADESANQIIEVGNLLVYVQLPLMFQKKSKRVFEQWGVFLLLELVVGALVNNNVLYGILMLPVLAIGSAAMMSLALFASQLRHSESISESTSIWSRLMHWLGKEQLATKANSGVKLSAVAQSSLSVPGKRLCFSPLRWSSGVIPLTMSVLVFSIGYFYSLPRLSLNSYDGNPNGSASVGFNEQVSLRMVGELLKNETPLFRMSMVDDRKRVPYRPKSPPYLRATVSHRYLEGPRRGEWQPGEPGLLRDARTMRDPPMAAQIDESLAKESDSVTVNILEKDSLGEIVPTIAPFSQNDTKNGFSVLRRDWRMLDTRELVQLKNQKRRYSYSTYAFTDGVESPLLPELRDCLREKEESTTANPYFSSYRREELTAFPDSLQVIIPFRDRILAGCKARSDDRFARAIFLEDYLANGPDFKYSLSITAPMDRSLDPIADFLLNKKTGHCQYYASALAMLLRSLGIPTRLVVGFRPGEYNEIGDYFLVQQNHAHVWVEAYFSVEELTANSIPVPSYMTRGAWMRLDGTPSGDGSNAGGTFKRTSGQTLGMMQELWSEMILNMDKSKQSTLFSIFSESSDDSYSNTWLSFKSAIERLRNNEVVGFVFSPSRWFSWKVALGITIMGFVAVCIHRALLWLFPTWVPTIRLRSPFRNRQLSAIDFYNNATRLLGKVGIQRASNQTQREFFHAAASKLRSQSIAFDGDLIARMFYSRRFGGLTQLPATDQVLVDSCLKTLEADLVNHKKSKASEPTE
jgi:protein-glutamine gamma-glutamyltransferase